MKILAVAKITLLIAAAAVLPGRNLIAQNAPAPATRPIADSELLPPQTHPAFSESFETGTIDDRNWEVCSTGTGTIAVEPNKFAHSKFALHVHCLAGNMGYNFIVATDLPDSVRYHFFGRAYVYFGPNIPSGHNVMIFAGTPIWPVSNFLELGLHGPDFQLSYQENSARVTHGEVVAKPSKTYPNNKWFCLEWEFNDNPDHITIWVDGERTEDEDFAYTIKDTGVTRSTGLVNSHDYGVANGFSDFGFGFRAWGAAAKTDIDIYYADIAIDTRRIGPFANVAAN